MAGIESQIRHWQSKMSAAQRQLSYSAKAEYEYAAAYKKLVQLGVVPKLRKKYRI